MNIIIFSKNRPAQLELCIRSIKEFFKEWKDNKIIVIYKTDREFWEGYCKLRSKYPRGYSNIILQQDIKFKQHLLAYMDSKYTMLMCDDDVFIRPFSVKDKQFKQFIADSDILCLNLRMDYGYNYCFDKDCYVSVPDFNNGTWQWRYYPLDWGFAMGTVGFIYRTKELKPLLERLDFTGPNTMEGQMAMNPLPQNKMLCYKKARTINIPLNLVQKVAPQNRAGNYSPESLNEKFMASKKISLNNILKRKQNFNSCFQLVKPVWEEK